MSKKNYIAWIYPISVMIIIFYFSSRTGTQSNAQSDPLVNSLSNFFHISPAFTHIIVIIVRKSAHILIYALLSFCTTHAMNKSSSTHIYLKSFLVDYTYAIFDECHQYFVPERSGAFVDTLIDSIGIIIGIMIYKLGVMIKKKFYVN